MNRIFLSIGPINIYWYSVLIVTSILIGLFLSQKEAEKNGLTKEFTVDLVFYLIPVAIIGARAYYVIFNFSLFKDDLLSIFKIWEGGLAIYGAIIASFIFIYFYCQKKKKSLLLTVDTFIPYLILGQAIGRWGNFINKEAHGARVTLSYLQNMHLPKFIIDGMYIDGYYYIPTFLYESLWCFLGFILLLLVRRKDKYQNNGLLFYIYLIWYGIERFIVEGMRTDSLYLGSFRISQIVSLVIVIIGLIGIIYLLINAKYKKKN